MQINTGLLTRLLYLCWHRTTVIGAKVWNISEGVGRACGGTAKKDEV